MHDLNKLQYTIMTLLLLVDQLILNEQDSANKKEGANKTSNMNKLRINSLILVEGEVHYISELFKEACISKRGGKLSCTAYSQIEVIPLTTDWLIDLGLKKFGVSTFYIGTFKIHKRKAGFFIAKRYKEVKYVHELQNIVLDLIDKELHYDKIK